MEDIAFVQVLVVSIIIGCIGFACYRVATQKEPKEFEWVKK